MVLKQDFKYFFFTMALFFVLLCAKITHAKNMDLVFDKYINIPSEERGENPQLQIMSDGSFFLLSDFKNSYKVFFLSDDLSLIKKKEIPGKIIYKQYPHLTTLVDNTILLQEWQSNTNYTPTKDIISYYNTRLLIINKEGEQVITKSINRIVKVLPPLSKQDKYLYLFGDDYHLLDRARFTDAFFLKYDLLTNDIVSLKMNVKLNNLVFAYVEFRDILPYSESDYLLFSPIDLYSKNIKDSKTVINENVSIYIVNIKSGELKLYSNLENKINNYIKKQNLKKYGKLTSITKQIVTKKIEQDTKTLVFDIRTTNRKNNFTYYRTFIGKYNLEKKELKIDALPDKYTYHYFIGCKNNVAYFWNYDNYQMVGFKLE